MKEVAVVVLTVFIVLLLFTLYRVRNDTQQWIDFALKSSRQSMYLKMSNDSLKNELENCQKTYILYNDSLKSHEVYNSNRLR